MARAVVVVFLVLAGLPVAAHAAVVIPAGSPLSGANESFLSGFANCNANPNSFAPTKALNDGSHIFVSTACENEKIYRFPLTGGATTDPGVTSAVTGTGFSVALDNGTYTTTGFTFFGGGRDGLYRFDPNSFALSQVTGAGFVTSNQAHDQAVDPMSGDLFVTVGTGTVYRIHDVGSSTPVITTFVAGVSNVDGIAFSADGSRIYVTASFGAATGISAYDRNGAHLFDVDLSSHAVSGIGQTTGVEVAGPNTVVAAQGGGTVDVSNNVFANNADGTVVRIDVNHGNAVTVAATASTALHYGHVDGQGCLYVPEHDTVIKFSPCLFSPSATGGGSGQPPGGPPSGGGGPGATPPGPGATPPGPGATPPGPGATPPGPGATTPSPFTPPPTPPNIDPLTVILSTNSIEFKVLLKRGIIVSSFGVFGGVGRVERRADRGMSDGA